MSEHQIRTFTIPPHNYPNLVAAAEGLLCETVELVIGTKLTFAVIGGWSPFLLNRGRIKHPGTHDVDLLFKDGGESGALQPVFDVLTTNGFVQSAKHHFQMLRILRVNDLLFVFNVDLLHASTTRRHPALFVDHVSLPVLLSEFNDESLTKGSIRAPVTDFIFDGHIAREDVNAILPNGTAGKWRVPLMDEVGTLITKAESMSLTKRQRDAFDIMITIRQSRDQAKLVHDLQNLRKQHSDAFAELTKLRQFCTEPRLRSNVTRFLPAEEQSDAIWNDMTSEIEGVLDAAGVPARGAGCSTLPWRLVLGAAQSLGLRNP
jgi:hypothetical protein